MACFLELPKELQVKITKKFFEAHMSNAQEIKISDLKVPIEIKAQEMWIEHEYEMSLVQLFHLHQPNNKPKIMLDCVEFVHFKFMDYPIISTSTIFNQVLVYLALHLPNDEIVYDYSSLFSNSYCPNNPTNQKA